MLRITTSNENGTTWIKLEGKLVGPWVEACGAECERLARSGAPFRLDLSAVGFVDAPGEEFLRGMATRGAVGASSSFVRELLRPTGRAHEALVRRQLPGLLTLARLLLRSEAEAAEAVQAAFRCVRAPQRASGEDSDPGAELRSLVLDACIARARWRPSTPSASIEPLLPRFDHAGNHARPIRPWPAPADVTPQVLGSAARRGIDDLPEPYRLVVLLHDAGELASGEVARRLDLPLADVRRYLHEGRQALIGLVRPAIGSNEASAGVAAKTA